MRHRNDIDPARTWLISDTHFGHKNIIGYCHRPEDFEQILLERINARVQDGDTLLHLGDLCYKGNSWFKNVIAPKIAPNAGRKLLIAGNHDHQRYSWYKNCGWKLTHPFYLTFDHTLDQLPGVREGDLGLADYIVSFSHYPWAADSSDGKLPFERGRMVEEHWRIHGHIHNNGYFDGRSITPPDYQLVPFLRNHVNLSCEMTKYEPVNLASLLDAVLLGKLPSGDTPGDGDAPSASDIGKENPHA